VAEHRCARASELNTKAVWALILATTVWGPGSIAAIFLGRAAQREIARSNGGQTGRPLARAAVVIGWIGLVFAAGSLIVVIAALRQVADSG
jgi:hypothetical protein